MIEGLTVVHTISTLVHFRLLRAKDGYVYDFTSGGFKKTWADCNDPTLRAVAVPEFLGATNGLYRAEVELGNINGESEPMEVILQAHDEAANALISTTSIYVVDGKRGSSL